MLKTSAQTPQGFFDLCLTEAGLTDSPNLKALQPYPPFAAKTNAQAVTDDAARADVLSRLMLARDTADALWLRGKPPESEAEARLLKPAEWQAWDTQWQAWAGARRPAFFARAALAMLGDRAALDYLLDQMRASDNILFQSAAFDALQHATGHYLDDADIERHKLERGALADWWRRWLADNAA